MPFAVINRSGCGIHKNRAKLRLDLYLNPNDPHFDKHYIRVPVIPEGGYPGEVEADGSPTNQKDHEAWLKSLPHVWQNTPFHSHFIYPDKDASDASIKAEIGKCLNYFYAFHQYCWDTGQQFCGKDKDGNVVGLWEKVPKIKGSVRDVFMKGNPKDLSACQSKVTDILSRVQEFQISVSKVSPQDLNIGEKGTIDVGSPAIDRDYHFILYVPDLAYTRIEGANPSNASGIKSAAGIAEPFTNICRHTLENNRSRALKLYILSWG